MKLTKPQLKTVLTKMCKMVGVEYYDVDFQDEQWYLTHEWTEEQENEFSSWLLKYLRKVDKKRTSVKRLREQIDHFLLNYSWTFSKGNPNVTK